MVNSVATLIQYIALHDFISAVASYVLNSITPC